MQTLRSVRWMLLALLLSIIPASSFAGVFISVGFAPPVLPIYEQPPCPEEGLMWSPGYWAYGDDGYYWVPGAWVPVPYEGALWTPPYWGWSEGLYVFHTGYWGQTVGYYGGVNYGYGYMGIGFAGGEWREHHFAYNTAVMRVNTTVIHNTYINQTVVNNTTIVNNHVAYSGGPGGVRHDPSQQEREAMRMPHVPPTTYQQQHIQAARSDRANYVKFNGGRPEHVVATRPLPAEHIAPPTGSMGNGGRFGNSVRPVPSTNGTQGGNIHGAPADRVEARPAPGGKIDARPAPVSRPDMRQAPAGRNEQQSRPAPSPQYQPQSRPAPSPQYQPQSRPAPSPQYQPQSRPAPSPQYQPQSRPTPSPQYQPQSRPAPSPQYQHESRPAPEPRPQPQARPAPAPRAEQQSRPAPAPRPEPKQKDQHN